FAGVNAKLHLSSIGVGTHQMERTLNQSADGLPGAPQSSSGAAEHEQRLQHFGGAVDGVTNLGEHLATLLSRHAVGSQKLGIGVNGGEVVAQVMGYRAGHAAYGRQTLGFEQSLVGLQNLTAHAREGGA